jgi:hypothetical protein
MCPALSHREDLQDGLVFAAAEHRAAEVSKEWLASPTYARWDSLNSEPYNRTHIALRYSVSGQVADTGWQAAAPARDRN